MSSRELRVTGQLTDGSRGSRVKKCDPLSSLSRTQQDGRQRHCLRTNTVEQGASFALDDGSGTSSRNHRHHSPPGYESRRMKCAENYNKRHNEFTLRLQLAYW